jgi:hypothetical protein
MEELVKGKEDGNTKEEVGKKIRKGRLTRRIRKEKEKKGREE